MLTSPRVTDSSHLIGSAEVEAAAGLSVRGASTVDGAGAARQELVDHSAAGLLAEKDPTLWGKEAEAEAEVRLGWVDTFRRSRELLPGRQAAGRDEPVLPGGRLLRQR